jgi:hypothetical protein
VKRLALRGALALHRSAGVYAGRPLGELINVEDPDGIRYLRFLAKRGAGAERVAATVLLDAIDDPVTDPLTSDLADDLHGLAVLARIGAKEHRP